MILSKLSLRTKIPLAIVGFAIFVGSTVGIVSFIRATSEIRALSESRLLAVAQSRAAELEGYLQSVRDDLVVTANLPYAAYALVAFNSAWTEMSGNKTDVLKAAYPLLFTTMRLGASRRKLDATAACCGVGKARGIAGVFFTAL